MSIPGVTAAERRAYLRAAAGDAMVQSDVHLLTLSHGFVSSATDVRIDGQVNYLPGDGIAKTLQMGFIDPEHSLRLDADSPTEGVAGMNRLVQVTQSLYVDELSRWVPTTVFTGRPSQMDRDGDTVTVEAQGKEALHLRTVAPFTIPAGTNYATAIRRCLTAGGEIRFRFPKVKSRLAKAVVVGGDAEVKYPWQVARRLARNIGMVLYYDGLGWACMRRPPGSVAWTLKEAGEGANILGRIKTTTDLTTVRNRVVVTGHIPVGKKTKPLKIAVNAPASHPHSAQSLAINGHPWYNTVYFDESTLHTKAQILAFARARLNELLTESVGVQTTAVPVYHLDPGDWLEIDAASASFGFRFFEGSVPLGPSDSGMSVNHIYPVRSPRAGRIRRAA